jgi:thioesterase domain-containing protein
MSEPNFKNGQIMDSRELQRYLHEHIPLSKAMAVYVQTASAECVTLSAPLAPNINHRETVFGGSASALAILSAWSLLHLRLKQEQLDGRIVIQKSTMNFERPIVAHFTATAALSEASAWPKFVNMLGRKGRARISVVATLHCREEKVGEFAGDFVALTIAARS